LNYVALQPDSEIVLRTEGLTKRFGDLTAVNQLSLDVYQGEIFGLLGPNGAGKTTSINMICGLLKPDSGKVVFRGVQMPGGSSVYTRVGVCPQTNILWERLTCIEQLQFIGEMYGLPGRQARQRGDELLAQMGLQDKRRKQARTLSGGMQRRLNLIMALVHDPEIVVLDEPEAGLDPQSRVMLREFVRSMAGKKTVILTTHNMDEAERMADRVAIIDHGELLVLDTPQALKHRLGKGDVVEIRLKNGFGDEAAARQNLAPISYEISFDEHNQLVQIRALNAVSHLPAIIEMLGAAHFQAGEVSVRANTLEDVFIQLTGRRLRE
jgi:ABC-2 type transport system ATP-binding protein